MAEGIHVFIVENHQLFREGLKSLLSERSDLIISGEAENGFEAIQKIRDLKPDLILLDLSMPKMGGISVLKEIKRDFPEIRILMLTIHESDNYVLESFEAGADGYCIKDSSREELMLAIDSVIDGKKFISPGIAENVMKGFLKGQHSLKNKSKWGTVTQREREVLKLLAEGHTNNEIADLLFISVKTVQKHRSNIMTKLNLHNVAALTRYAVEKGLLGKHEGVIT